MTKLLVADVMAVTQHRHKVALESIWLTKETLVMQSHLAGSVAVMTL